MILFALNKESAIWKDESMKTLLRCDQLKQIDFQRMRMVTNHRCVTEQSKSDKVENVVTGGSKIVEFGEEGGWQRTKYEELRDEWSQNWKS